MYGDIITLTREVDAIAIPSGTIFKMEKGTEVTITQSLGGTHTVSSRYGLSRIEEKDQDALGMELPQAADIASANGAISEDQVWEKLKLVFDPEIPVNIVDLGLVYHMAITPVEDGANVDVKMTLTAPGCGMGPTLQADARNKIESIPGVKGAKVDLVWEPPWNQEMITEAGKMQLGLI